MWPWTSASTKQNVEVDKEIIQIKVMCSVAMSTMFEE